MFPDATPIQIFNTIANVLGITLFVPVVWFITSRIQRLRDRYAHIEKRLDHILLLTHELYQSEVKDKTIAPNKTIESLRPTVGTQDESGVGPRLLHQPNPSKTSTR